MSAGRPVLRNALLYGVSTGSNVFLLVLAVLAARYLGPIDFGVFSFAIAFVVFFDFLIDPGLYHLLIREIARAPESTRDVVKHALAWKVLAAPIFLLLIAVVLQWTGEPERVRHAVYLMGGAALLKSTKDVYRTALLAHERFGLEALSSVFERGVLLAAGAGVMVAGYGLIALCLMFVLVRIVDLLVIRLLAGSVLTGPATTFDFRFLRGLIKAGAPIGVFYLALNLYNYIDTVMISSLRGPAEVGWYNAGYRIYEAFVPLPVIIGTVLMPRLSLLHGADRARFGLLVTDGWKYTLVLSLLITGVGVPLAADVIRLCYGDEYQPSSIALQILLAGVPFLFLITYARFVLIAMDRQQLLLKVTVPGLAANVLLNLVLIPRAGFAGAAVATVLVEAGVCIALGLGVARHGADRRFAHLLMTSIACWLVAVAVAWGLLRDMPAYVRAIALAAVYGPLLLGTGVIERRELELVRGVLQFRRRLDRAG